MGLVKQMLDASLRFLRRPVPPSRRAGRPGTAIFGGFINTIEKNRKLSDREKYRTFSEILANVSISGRSARNGANSGRTLSNRRYYRTGCSPAIAKARARTAACWQKRNTPAFLR